MKKGNKEMAKNPTSTKSKKAAAASNGRPMKNKTAAARGKASSRRSTENVSEKKMSAKKALTIRAFQTAYDRHHGQAS